MIEALEVLSEKDRECRWVLEEPRSVFQVIPASPCRTRYPVTAIINRDTPEAVTRIIEGPYEERGPASGIRTVDLINLQTEDAYQLYVGNVGDTRHNYLRTSSDGYTALRSAPPVTLFTQEYRGEDEMQTAALSGGVYFVQDLPSIGGVRCRNAVSAPADTFSAWDLRDYRNLRFVVESSGPFLGSGATFTPFVELFPIDVRAAVRDSSGVGIYGYGLERVSGVNMGAGSSSRVTAIQLGCPQDASGSGYVNSARWAPFVRLGVEVAGNTFPGSGAFPLSSSYKFRVTALAW